MAEDLGGPARWNTVRELDSPGGWAHRVAVNLAVSHRRRRDAEGRAYARVGVDAGGGERDVSAEMSVRAALESLDAKARAAVVLRYVADVPSADAGAALGMSADAVRVLTHRALADLRRKLGEPEPTSTEVCA